MEPNQRAGVQGNDTKSIHTEREKEDRKREERMRGHERRMRGEGKMITGKDESAVWRLFCSHTSPNIFCSA